MTAAPETAAAVGRPTAGPALTGNAERLYLLLAALFVGALVVTNLIANKFLTVDLGFKVFVLSAGALPYPLTFLVTDLLSEIYGKQRANRVVWAGFAVSLFVLAALWLGSLFPAIDGVARRRRDLQQGLQERLADHRGVDDGLSHGPAHRREAVPFLARSDRRQAPVAAQQRLDGHLAARRLHAGGAGAFRRELSRSTGCSRRSWILWLFKALVALADTPLFYAGTALLTRWTGLQAHEHKGHP